MRIDCEACALYVVGVNKIEARILIKIHEIHCSNAEIFVDGELL